MMQLWSITKVLTRINPLCEPARQIQPDGYRDAKRHSAAKGGKSNFMVKLDTFVREDGSAQ